MNIIVISGPAGSGKTTLAASIVAAVAPEKDSVIAATRNNCKASDELVLGIRLRKEKMGGTMIDYSIASVSETSIIDVFEYKS